ncbi:MAG: 2-hydroxyacid dehydrogenase [Nocardioides sp.]
MTRPLVWLPFERDELGEYPESLRYECISPQAGMDLPDSVTEVEFYVPPYPFTSRDAEILGQMKSLRVLQTMSAGVDHLRPAVRDDVTLCNGRGVHTASTAELTVAMILASQRGIPDFVRLQEREVWQPERLESLADRTVLIVGYGDIGRAIERRLDGFEVDILRVARHARDGVAGFEELPALLPRADVVVLIVPITDETRGMVDADFLAEMKEGALLVNVARGSVVVTDDLLAALYAGRVRAALDVTDPEPLPSGHPLWRAPGALVLPHVAGGSSAMWPRAYRLIREQLYRFEAGEPLANVVTGDY